MKFAKDSGLLVAVRGGGTASGLSVCDGGIVIDLSLMKGIRVDPEARTVRAQAGVLLGELDRETQEFGLAVPSGIVTHTGLSGLTLGGGINWLHRKYGLAIDQLLSVDLITAEGEFVKASETENEDLFWGVRRRRQLRHRHRVRVPPQSGRTDRARRAYLLAHRGGTRRPTLLPRVDSGGTGRTHDDRNQPEGTIACLRAPRAARQAGGGRLVLLCRRCRGRGEGRSRSRSSISGARSVRAQTLLAHQAMFDPSFPHGRWYYIRACDVAQLTDEVIDITVDHALLINSPFSALTLWQRGGAVARVGEDETAFGGRSAGHTYNITGATEGSEGFEEERQWVRNFWTALEPYHTSVYVNFLMEEGEERIRQAYGARKYDRLKALKRRYDPDNLFRLNQNIRPDATT